MLTLSPEEQLLADKLTPEGCALGQVVLRLQPWQARPKGVLIMLIADGTPCDLRLPLTVWHNWCENLLGTADTDHIDPQLLTSILEWGLSPLLTACGLIMAPHTTLRPCIGTAAQLVVTFSWQVEQQAFQGVLIGFPNRLWHRIAAGLTPPLVRRPNGVPPPMATALCIGECHLTLAELRQLGPGVGMRLRCVGDPQAGEFALILPGECALRITWNGEKIMKIDALMQDLTAHLDEEVACDGLLDNTNKLAPEHGVTRSSEKTAGVEPAALVLDTLPQRIRVDVGQLELTLGALQTLTEGDIVPVTGEFSPHATLRINGRMIGQGELVLCGKSFLVRITRWYLDVPEVDQANTG